ncbi:MAG: DUF3488 domain-containing transglutaminase family protein [Myxococcales bacterium]|nr:DUF3488 domain-containing transglutaminase family protein [Myxococcales bacterium]
MRFAQAHKVTTYAVIMSAFLAVAVSGLLNPLVVILALASIAGSWFWEPPRIRFETWSLVWTTLASLIFVYEVISVLAGSEILLAGAEFLVTLLLAKLYHRRESKDYLHLYLLSFLLLTAGTVLNAEVTYGFFFLCYVVSFTWAMTIFHLRRELENNFLLRHGKEDAAEQVQVQRVMNSKRIVGRKFFIGTSIVSLTIFASALSLFLLFPRIGFGFFFDKGRGGITMAGFSEGVELGGHGVIKKDTTVVMRVEVDSQYAGRQAPYIHWRGVAFDKYSKGKWGYSSRQEPKTERKELSGKRWTTNHLLYDKPWLKEAALDKRLEGSLKQNIYLEPIGSSVLFGASMPLAFETEIKINKTTEPGRHDAIHQHHNAGIKYTVYSDPRPPRAELLRGAGTKLPKGFQRYLQLPEEIPVCANTATLPLGEWQTSDISGECRVRELARWITRDATTQYDKALALETWLRNEIGYTLEMESPGAMEPVEFFLFERQVGHCEYFSSAMAVMARSLGIPTRNVNGFLGGEWNEYDSFIAVRAGDAHSWVEVYFPGQGWVTFDPTPAGEADFLGRGSLGFLDKMRRIADTLRFKWSRWVIEYDLYSQLELFKNFGSSVKKGANQYFRDPLRRASAWARRHKSEAAALVIFVGLLIGMISYWRSRKRVEETLAPRRANRKRGVVMRNYLATLRVLARRGFRRDDATTPREFARGLEALRVPGAEDMVLLTELYYEDEYSEKAASVADSSNARAEALARSIQSALKESKTNRRGLAPI